MGSNVPGVEHKDPQYFGYYAMLQHQVSSKFYSFFLGTVYKRIISFDMNMYI